MGSLVLLPNWKESGGAHVCRFWGPSLCTQLGGLPSALWGDAALVAPVCFLQASRGRLSGLHVNLCPVTLTELRAWGAVPHPLWSVTFRIHSWCPGHFIFVEWISQWAGSEMVPWHRSLPPLSLSKCTQALLFKIFCPRHSSSECPSQLWASCMLNSSPRYTQGCWPRPHSPSPAPCSDVSSSRPKLQQTACSLLNSCWHFLLTLMLT